MGKNSSNYIDINQIFEFPEPFVLLTTPRGVGKTSGLTVVAIRRFIETGKKFILVRRRQDDLFRAFAEFFPPSILERSGISGGTVEKGVFKIQEEEGAEWLDCGRGMALSLSEKYRGPSYEDYDFMIFDEFTTTGQYLPREVFKFLDLAETIFRKRKKVKIILAGNQPVTYCPYFDFLPPSKTVRHFDYMPPSGFLAMAEDSPLFQATRGTAWHKYAYFNDYFGNLKLLGLIFPAKTHPQTKLFKLGGFQFSWLTQRKVYHVSPTTKEKEATEKDIKRAVKIFGTGLVAFEDTETIYQLSKILPNSVEFYLNSFLEISPPEKK